MKKRTSKGAGAATDDRGAGRKLRRHLETMTDDADWELSPAQLRSLRRRLKDARDPTRFLLVSRFSRRFALYYNVSDDVYVMNDPLGATLFKRRRTALAVERLLGPRVQLVRCTTRLHKGARVPMLPPKARAPRKKKGPGV